MLPIPENELTRLKKEQLCNYDFKREELPGKEDIEDFNVALNFIEYVQKYAQKCGYSNEISDVSKLISFILKKCKEADVSISRQTLTNWLTESPPSGNKARENVYQLCFALQMDVAQTQEFFLKAFLERPFNYKDIHEAVYFFCLIHGLKYGDAQRIIKCVELSEIIKNPSAENITKVIGERICEMNSEEELIQYLINNRSEFSDQNKSATDLIKQLLEQCKEIAPEEYRLCNAHEKDIKVRSTEKLLSIIYGYNSREAKVKKDEQGVTIKNKKGNPVTESIHKKTISDSNFPAYMKYNWPQTEQFSRIKNHKASYDMIRRALIMLKFYHFMADAEVNIAKEDIFAIEEMDLFSEFVDEMNAVLDACGYVQLYWRNPFDWMIGYCARSYTPLETLRNLISEYYLEPIEGYF